MGTPKGRLMALEQSFLERKDAWAFLAVEVGGLLASSAGFRGLCWKMLESGGGGAEFELGLRGALVAICG